MKILSLDFHQDQIPSNQKLEYYKQITNGIYFSSNYSISVRAIQRKFLDYPYGECYSYESDGQPFNARSQTQCYRKCVREYCEKHYKCIPLFIDYYIHENDFKGRNENKFCSLKENLLFEKWLKQTNYEEKCRSLCPKNCIQTQYFWKTKRKKFSLFDGNEYWFKQGDDEYRENNIVWDTSQPMFAYIEEPVMTFTDYLVDCGGLLGIWFGTSAKDLLISVSNIVLNYFSRLSSRSTNLVVPFN